MKANDLITIARGGTLRRHVLYFVEAGTDGQPIVTDACFVQSDNDIAVLTYPIVEVDRKALQPQIDKLLQQ